MSIKSIAARLWRRTFPARCFETLRWQFRRVRLHPASLLLIKTSDLSIKPGTRIGPRCVFEAQGSRITIGSDCWFYRDIELRTTTGIHIGRGSTFQTGVLLNGTVTVGAGCIFAPRVFISSGTHIFQQQPELPIRLQESLYAQSPDGAQPYRDKPVSIGEDCWLGVNAVIMPGVTIGRGSVIGANSVVTKNVPPYSIVAGAPARVLKQRLEWKPPMAVDCTDTAAAPYLYSGFLLSQDNGTLNATADDTFTLALPKADFESVDLHIDATNACAVTVAGQRFEVAAGNNHLCASVAHTSLVHIAEGVLVPCAVIPTSSIRNAIRIRAYAAKRETSAPTMAY